MNLYFSGIGGIGISALAQYCVVRGDRVVGSEISLNAITENLESLGVEIYSQQIAANLPSDTDLLIYTEAVPATNPERQQADKLGILQKSYFEYLGEISKTKRTIAVAGTHGKTTTVGMIAGGFKSAEFDATVFIGSTLPEFDNQNFHAGSNDWLLVEACEYRNNFQFLEPEIVVLTNAEYDHPDAYESEEAYLNTMKDFCMKAKMVIHHGDELSLQILKDFQGETIIISPPPCQRGIEGDLNLSIPGEHNRENGSLAFALATHLESLSVGLTISAFKNGLSSFSGTGRRQEYLGQKDGIHIYDDYGHHPTAIRVTMQAFREKYPNSKIALIYEPHQYSRTREFKDEFLSAFESADFFGLYPIYEARDSEEDKASISREDLLSTENKETMCLVDTIQDVQSLSENLSSGDVLVFMGAGKISQFAREFLKHC